MKKLLLTLTALALLSVPARAVDNSGHTLGVGAVADFGSTGVPATLSMKIPIKPRFDIGVLLGFKIASTSQFDPGLKFWYVVIPEKYMNLYVAGSFAVDLNTNKGFSTFLLHAGPGVELFTSEWPNLGFMAEFGLTASFANGGGSYLTTDSATAYGLAGVHYYF